MTIKLDDENIVKKDGYEYLNLDGINYALIIEEQDLINYQKGKDNE